MELAGLCAVALIYKHHEIALGRVIFGQSFLDFLNVLVNIFIGSFTTVFAKLVYQRTNQRIFIGVELVDKICATLGADNILINTLVCLFNLIIEFFTVSYDKNTRIGVVSKNPLGKPYH